MNTITKVRASEGLLVTPPPMVQNHLSEREAFWSAPSPDAHLISTLENLRNSWLEVIQLLAESQPDEVPEIFQMPTPHSVKMKVKISEIKAAPFVFIDDFPEEDQ